ncbi:MAG: TIM barrel protein [Pseudomonadota bacterium]
MEERFGAARSAGFQGVEIPFPYDHAVPDILDRLSQNDLDFVMITCPPPNYTGAERGFAAVPGQEERFRRDFGRTMRYAKALGVLHVHIMSGAVKGPEAYDTLIDNLRWAVKAAPHQSLTLEPMCQEDVPGYYLNNALKAAEIVQTVAAPNLGLQFDVHHIHQIHGDVLGMWEAVGGHVTHIQLAQSPLRGRPDSEGGVDIAAFLKVVKGSGYKGWISGEYLADAGDDAHLFWI